MAETTRPVPPAVLGVLRARARHTAHQKAGDSKVSNDRSSELSRRTFLGRSGALAGGVLLGAGSAAMQQAAAASGKPSGNSTLPKRVLGRTGVQVTTITLGTAPCGFSPQIPPPEIAKIVNFAIDRGITSIDTAPAYIQAEEGVGLALGSRRKEVFLATKVLADTIEEAEKSLTTSFRLLKTDYLDLVYYHSVGDHDVQKALDPDGVFTWLLKQKEAGKFRFLGISGHNRPGKFLPLLETGEVDVLLTVVNFVDRHTYNFEEKVLPLARKHNTGIVAMKVFGGASKSAGSYKNPKAPPELPIEHLEQAVRYALGIPGVATVNLGVHNIEQVQKNVEMVARFRPLSPPEEEQLQRLGKKLAAKWGTHFGPVA